MSDQPPSAGSGERNCRRVRSRNTLEEMPTRPTSVVRTERRTPCETNSSRPSRSKIRNINPNTPAGWQYPSSSRCLACGALGCQCRSARLDRETKRQKLDTLRWNTPYEKAKVVRATEDLRHEETRRRAKLQEQWEDGFRRRQLGEVTEHRMVYLIGEETLDREDIERLERQQHNVLLGLLACHTALSALQNHEHEARRAIVAKEKKGRWLRRNQYDLNCRLAHLFQQEVYCRDTICSMEGAEWNGIKSNSVASSNVMLANAQSRLKLCETCMASRSKIERKWSNGADALAMTERSCRALVLHYLKKRDSLMCACEMRSVRIVEEEKHTRCCLAREMTEARNLVEERRRITTNQRNDLVVTEERARYTLVADESAELQRLLLLRSADEEDIRELEMANSLRYETEMRQALAHLTSIIRKEEDVFASLLSQEVRERDQRYQFMLHKVAQQNEFIQQHMHARELVECAERSEWKALYQQRQQEEASWLQWVSWRARQMRELEAGAVTGASEINKEEHSARFALLSLMAEDEDAVRRRLQQHSIQRQNVIQVETETRMRFLQSEQDARERIYWENDTRLENLIQSSRQRAEQLVRLEQRCLAALEAVCHTEESERCILLYEMHQDRLNADMATRYRVQLALQEEEVRGRSLLVHEEVRDRESLFTILGLQLRHLEKEFQELLATQRYEIVATEQSARVMIEDASCSAFAFLCHNEHQELLAVGEALKARFRDELRVRQAHMEEDRRAYDETEVLEFYECRTTPLSNSSTPDAPMDRSLQLQQKLVLQTLGNPEFSGELSPRTLQFLVALLDAVNDRRAQLHERCRKVEKQASSGSKTLLRLEECLAAEREKKEAYAVKMKSDTVEREHRMALAHKEKLREVHEMEAERRRLAEAEAALALQENELCALRSSIHKKFRNGP